MSKQSSIQGNMDKIIYQDSADMYETHSFDSINLRAENISEQSMRDNF